jgi:hypothetical protein
MSEHTTETPTTHPLTVTSRTPDAIFVDEKEGRQLRDGLRSHRDEANAAKKQADAIAAIVNAALDGANHVYSSTGEHLFFIKEINKAPAINWEALEADLRTIGKTKSNYEVSLPKTRQLHTVAPVTVVPPPSVPTVTIPVQISSDTAPEIKTKKKAKK